MSWNDLMSTAEKAGLSFDPVPDGQYEVTVEKAEGTVTSNGKGMIKTTFVINSGPFDTKKLFNQFVISPESENAMAFFFRHMAVFGLDKAFFAQCPPPLQGGTQRIAASIVGKRVRVAVGQKEYQGQLRNEVKGIMPSAVAGNQVGASPTGLPGIAPVQTPTPPPAQVPVVDPAASTGQLIVGQEAAAISEAQTQTPGGPPKPPF